MTTFKKGDRVFVKSLNKSSQVGTMKRSVNDGIIYTVRDVDDYDVYLNNGFWYNPDDIRHITDTPYKSVKQEPQMFNIENLQV